jgi:ATP-dependent helicase/nuclease subunit A
LLEQEREDAVARRGARGEGLVTAPPRRPRDHDARRRAATDFATNLVVSAGAGTGKTTLLVERILAAIGSGHAPLPAIAAITFTDKAAGELRHRLASGLAELRELASGSPRRRESTSAENAFAWLTGDRREKPADIAARAWEAETVLDRAAVTTIHGFCSEILRAYPLEAGLAPGFVADRGLQGRRLAQDEWTPFVESELGPEGRRGELWARVFGTFTLSELAELGRELASGAIPEAVLRGDVRTLDLREALGSAARGLGDEIRRAVERTSGLTGAPREWFDEAERALRRFADEGAAAARQAIASAARVPDAVPKVKSKNVSDAEAEALSELAVRAAPLLRALAAYDAGVEADLLSALLPFARRLRQRQTRAGLVDFDALLVRARDLLRDHRAVRAAVKRRYAMILVDEFQDTDPIQYEIVFFLAESAREHASDAYATRLAPGRIFIVGDAKQSIYRFRGADFAAYQRAVQHVLDEGGAGLSLTSNFRSTAAILGPINALFAAPGSSDWRASAYLPPYEPIEAEREDGGAPAVELWTTPRSAANAGERRRAEGLALAAELARIAGPGKPWRFDDVLVLLRGFSDLSPYLRALREAGVPFVVSGGRTFFTRPEITQAMAVLRAVADPGDAVALLAYRRSPAGGVPDTELAARAAGSGPAPALDAADARLESLRAEASKLPVDAAVRRVLDASGLVALSGLAFEAAQRVANLEKLCLAASELARDGRRTLLETLDALEEGFESDDEGDSPLADADRDAVRVMTIHKAKGLEARVVILADAAAGRSNRPPRGAEARMSLRSRSFRNGAAIAASLEDASHEEAEDIRLLYVALTRARDRLFVFGGGNRRTDWTDALSGWSAGVTHRVLDHEPSPSRDASPPPVGAPGAVARYEAAVAAVASLAAPPFRSPSDEADHVEAAAGALPPELAREVGSIVHARLANLPVEANGRARDEADAVLRAFRESPLAAHVSQIDVLGREVPLLLDEEGARWRGSIDLLYRDARGDVVVADYKTDATDAGAIDRHREQLAVYARAVRRALPGERVRAELWMLRTGTILEV